MLPYTVANDVHHPGTDEVWIEAGQRFGPATAADLLAAGVLLSRIAVAPTAPTTAQRVLLALARYYRQ